MDPELVPQTSQQGEQATELSNGPENSTSEVVAQQQPDQPHHQQQQQQQRQQQPPQQNQFGAVRERIFHVMLVRMALSYSQHIPRTARRFIEFFSLLTAVCLFGLMLYVHIVLSKQDNTCLTYLDWPRDGVLRVEVVSNLNKLNNHQETLQGSDGNNSATNVCKFSLRSILKEGPSSLPKELQTKRKFDQRKKNDHWSGLMSFDETLFNIFLSYYSPQKLFNWKESNLSHQHLEEDEDNEESDATFEYVVEYSLHYGLLRLPHTYRVDHNIPFLLVRLDPETDQCFGDWLSRFVMKYFIGYEDVLMASMKALAENESDKGYLRDMITGEHYRFVTMNNGKMTYFTALFVMLIFTFAISMLLRFSHQQIFLFIVDLLQMFELNQALVFPAAPLLTVILALVGIETIMSEVFNDTSTAFYVILLVWIADQYDAICCQSPISKRHWLRFFYLYHYAFYAYQYRYNGQYGGVALLASSVFILHSMIFFFHHYELPLILYHDRLQRIINDIQHIPIMNDETNREAGVEMETGAMQNPESPSSDINERNTFQDDRTSNTTEISNIGSNSRLESSDTAHASTANYPSDNAERPSARSHVSETIEVEIHDPLISAGEVTANRIVENAIHGLFDT